LRRRSDLAATGGDAGSESDVSPVPDGAPFGDADSNSEAPSDSDSDADPGAPNRRVLERNVRRGLLFGSHEQSSVGLSPSGWINRYGAITFGKDRCLVRGLFAGTLRGNALTGRIGETVGVKGTASEHELLLDVLGKVSFGRLTFHR